MTNKELSDELEDASAIMKEKGRPLNAAMLLEVRRRLAWADVLLKELVFRERLYGVESPFRGEMPDAVERWRDGIEE